MIIGVGGIVVIVVVSGLTSCILEVVPRLFMEVLVVLWLLMGGIVRFRMGLVAKMVILLRSPIVLGSLFVIVVLILMLMVVVLLVSLLLIPLLLVVVPVLKLIDVLIPVAIAVIPHLYPLTIVPIVIPVVIALLLEINVLMLAIES